MPAKTCTPRSLTELEQPDGQPFTVSELAALVRHSRWSIHRWIAKGDLPAVRVGYGRRGQGVFLIPFTAVRRFMLDRIQRPQDMPPAADDHATV